MCIIYYATSIRLLQRYQNVKMELEAQQNLERIRMEKLVQSGALMAPKKKKGGSVGSRSVSTAPENDA